MELRGLKLCRVLRKLIIALCSVFSCFCLIFSVKPNQEHVVDTFFNTEISSISQTFSDSEPHIGIPFINSIRTLLNILREGDILLLDIDDTILLPGRIKYLYPATLLDESLPETIKIMRDKGIVVLFLTARNPIFSGITEKQLKDLGINVFDFMEFKTTTNLSDVGLFKNGIIYAPNQESKCMKGEVFKTFLKKCLFQNSLGAYKLKDIQRVFFVDDLRDNIQQFLSVFYDDHLYKNVSFNVYIFKNPKPRILQIQTTPGFVSIFEVCHNLYILVISVIKSCFSSLCISMEKYFR